MTDRDSLKAYVHHREEMEVFDHNPADPTVGHESCTPRCKPVDRFVVENWKDADGNPIVDRALLLKLEAARRA